MSGHAGVMRVAVAALCLAIAPPDLAVAQGTDAAAAEGAGQDGSKQSDPKAPRGAAALDALLAKVREGYKTVSDEAGARQARFVAEKDQQAEKLAELHAEAERLSARSAELEAAFEEGEKQLTELQELLDKRMGDSGELFGAVREVAGDARGHLRSSITSAQYPDRVEQLAPIAESKALPTLEQLQTLWYLLHQELTAAGQVGRFEAEVVDAEGHTRKEQVTRVGSFNAVANGRYLIWDSDEQQLAELSRAPAERYAETAAALSDAKAGDLVVFGIDPARGAVLSMLVSTPTWRERIDQGGAVGYAIIALGSLAFVLALLRLAYLLVMSSLVERQARKADTPRSNNPLGRVLIVYREHRDAELPVLERHLEDAVTRESNRVDRLAWLVRAVTVVAPLMGLLGTVTGMIQTFQAITLFGTGDPKLMAGGISEALVTTMLGLVVAIPLLLMHSGLAGLTKRITSVLYEQAAGLVALEAEREPQA